MVKISQLPQESNPSVLDKIPLSDPEATPPATKYATLQSIISTVFANVPAGAIPGSVFDYVISGAVWSADAAGSTRNASMSAGVFYISSQSVAIAAVTGRTFTASRDTYIDVLNNLDGTGTLVYTEVANNAASPALAANSIRIGIVVTGAGSIADANSINQGQLDRVLPITSSTPYSVTDSLGNLICPRDPSRRILGHRRIVANSGGFTAEVDIAGLSVPVIVPEGRKIKVSVFAHLNSSISGDWFYLKIKEGATILQQLEFSNQGTSPNYSVTDSVALLPSSGLHTYKLTGTRNAGSGTAQIMASSTQPAFILVELV
jgi:hypothetical protein